MNPSLTHLTLIKKQYSTDNYHNVSQLELFYQKYMPTSKVNTMSCDLIRSAKYLHNTRRLSKVACPQSKKQMAQQSSNAKAWKTAAWNKSKTPCLGVRL